MAPPLDTKAWVISDQSGIDGIQLVEQLRLPSLGEYDVLIKLHAASLNYRDVMIAKGSPALEIGKAQVVPGSDGAGIVEAIGSMVSSVHPGDRVCTCLTVNLEESELPTFASIGAGLGQTVNGTLQQFGVFHETSVVLMPANLDFLHASTLTCSGLTAFNALFGLPGKGPKPGDVVVVQGTGGVSIAALQFSLAAGATVIATTSSQEKSAKLSNLGAQHVLNYRETPQWGKVIRTLTQDNRGADIVVDVGGASTLRQSLDAVRTDGMIAAIGILGETPDGHCPTLLDCTLSPCVVRGLFLGSRRQFKQMNEFVEMHGIQPVIDHRVFDMGSMREAYHLLSEQKHFSKVTIQIE